jgi:hypothetical protein
MSDLVPDPGDRSDSQITPAENQDRDRVALYFQDLIVQEQISLASTIEIDEIKKKLELIQMALNLEGQIVDLKEKKREASRKDEVKFIQLVRLTADRIVDISRFVAIVPNEENQSYSLILEGSDRDIPIYQDDLNIITKYLNDRKISTPNPSSLADLAKPQAVAVIQARIAKHEAMSDEESAIRAAAWEKFKQNIDAD